MTTFFNESDVTDNLAFYIENEAQALSQRDDFAIQNYVDREAFNPEVAAYLQQPQAVALLGSDAAIAAAGIDQPSKFAALAAFKSHDATSMMSLTSAQETQFFFRLPSWLRFRFNGLKKLVKSVFCSVATTIDDTDTKTLIKAVLVALIPAFGAGGVPGIVGGILIGIVALMLKKGIQSACPI